MSTPATQLYIVRHGQTDWNRDEIFRGRADRPLTELGHRQAEAAGEALESVQIEAIYSSPLVRAVDTAAPTARIHGLEIQNEEGLIDIDYGEWQGVSRPDVMERFPELYRTWIEAPHRVTFPGGEGLAEVRARVLPAVKRLAASHAESTIALFSHRVVIKVLLCALLGLDDSHFWEIRQDPGAVNRIELSGDEVALVCMNDTCHLRSVQPDAPIRDF